MSIEQISQQFREKALELASQRPGQFSPRMIEVAQILELTEHGLAGGSISNPSARTAMREVTLDELVASLDRVQGFISKPIPAGDFQATRAALDTRARVVAVLERIMELTDTKNPLNAVLKGQFCSAYDIVDELQQKLPDGRLGSFLRNNKEAVAKLLLTAVNLPCAEAKEIESIMTITKDEFRKRLEADISSPDRFGSKFIRGYFHFSGQGKVFYGQLVGALRELGYLNPQE